MSTDIAAMLTDAQRESARILGRVWAQDHPDSFGPTMADIPGGDIQAIADSRAPEHRASTMSIQALNREFTRAALERLRTLAEDPRARKYFEMALDDGT